jgi:hypothetical protein
MVDKTSLRIASVVVALGVALASAQTFAQRATWRTLRIDGDSPRAFELSVATLQNSLPHSKRGDLEVALLTIWLTHSTKAGNLDENAEPEINDVPQLKEDAADLLAAIQRGDLVSAIEDLDETDNDRTVASYIAQLDGLGHDAIFDLAGRPGDSTEVGRALRALKARTLCERHELAKYAAADLSVRQKWCDAYFRSPSAPR